MEVVWYFWYFNHLDRIWIPSVTNFLFFLASKLLAYVMASVMFFEFFATLRFGQCFVSMFLIIWSMVGDTSFIRLCVKVFKGNQRKLILQLIPLIFSPRLPKTSVENSQLLDYVRYRCLTQNLVVTFRPNTESFVWLATATTQTLGKKEMHI